jgi:hypothetical protein
LRVIAWKYHILKVKYQLSTLKRLIHQHRWGWRTKGIDVKGLGICILKIQLDLKERRKKFKKFNVTVDWYDEYFNRQYHHPVNFTLTFFFTSFTSHSLNILQ